MSGIPPRPRPRRPITPTSPRRPPRAARQPRRTPSDHPRNSPKPPLISRLTCSTVNAAALRACCLDRNGAIEDFPFGADVSVFKVGGKIFALSFLGRTPLEVSLKCEPELAVDLRATYAAVRPGWHLNKRHWNTVTLDGSMPDRLVRDMVEDSYDLVVSKLPKRVQLELDWRHP